jgi:hypothetical protein
MACQINRTKDGKINSVTTPSGAKSKLFEAIHGNVFLADAETSIKVYNNMYSPKVEKIFEGETANKYDTGEPQLFYKSPSNKVYDNLEEVLINEDMGSISMGFKNPKNEEFIAIANFTNKGSEKNEFITSKVREGLMSADRVLGVDGITRFRGKGEYDTTRKVTALFVASDLAAETGNGRVKVLDDGTIEMEFSKGYSEVIGENGSSAVIKTETIPEYLKENPNVENKVELAIEYVMKHDNPRPIDKDREKANTKTTDIKSLENSLMGFLKGLGFSTTSLESYRNNYNTKYGEGTDISALADIANKIVAFADGKISAEDLSEEVSHIAIESFSDQASITTALANVHLTPEYTEFSERYRKRYGNDGLSTVQLEDKVRKEILGKLLKKEITSRFSTENKTAEESYLIGKLKAIWEYFNNMLRVNMKPYHVELIDELNVRIADSILNDNSEDFLDKLIEGNTNYYYSLMDKDGKIIHDELRRGREHIEGLYNQAINEPAPSLTALDDMEDSMSENKTLSAVNLVIGTAGSQMIILRESARKATEKGERMSTTDLHRYEMLKDSLLPTVNNLMASLEKNKSLIKDKSLLHKIGILSKAAEQLSVDMGKVEPSIHTDKLAWVDRMLLKILDHTSLTDKQKDKVKLSLEGNIKDIGFLGKMFGLSSHSKNLALQLLHHSVMDITTKTNGKFLSKANEFLTDLNLKNGMKYQRSINQKGLDGKASYFVDSFRDYQWGEKMMLDKSISLLMEKTGKTQSEIEKELEKKLPQELLDDKTFLEYKEELNDFKLAEVNERRMKPEYYENQTKNFDEANVSKETRDYLSRKNSNMNARHREGGHIDSEGKKDLSNQTDFEKRQDLEDKQKHSRAASPYDTMGELKPGLRTAKISELTDAQKASIPIEISESFTGAITVLSGEFSLEELSKNYPDSRLALDIFNHNMRYRNALEEGSKSNDAIEEFFKKIQEVEDKNEKDNNGVTLEYNWLESNASLAINSVFYEGTPEGSSRDDITQEHINNISDTAVRDSQQVKFDFIKELKKSRSELLKQNKKSHSSVEYDAKFMTDEVRSRVRDLDTEIAGRIVDLAIPFDVYENLGESRMEAGLNEDYDKMLAEKGGYDNEFEFALKHTPEHNKEGVRAFAREVDNYINKRTTFIKTSFSNFIQKQTDKGLLDPVNGENLTKEEISKALKTAYARDNVATYFKRFTPKGYTQALDAMKNGTISISEMLENKEQFLEEYPALEFMDFNPDYSWREDVTNEDMVNPNFKSGDPYIQTKKLNDATFEKYWETKAEQEQAKKDYMELDQEDLNLLTPTKNVEEYNYLKATVAMNKEIIANYNLVGKSNPYMRVQMKKEVMERALTVYKAGNRKDDLKDWLGDIIKSQIDEKEYGEQIGSTGINIKKVPKYFQERVENPSFLTENTIQASLMSLKASIRYKERLLAEQDIKAIEYKISQQNFKSSGGNSIKSRIQKKGEVSNYYAKAQEMVDYHLYGIRQSRKMITTVLGKEVDFTQIFSKMTRYVRNVNLAFNPLVDITSYTTGVYNNMIDTIVGDYYHKSSVAEASKRLPNLMRLYMSEEGKVKKSSELNHLLEWLNVFSEEERLSMSAYNRGTRAMSNSYYLGAKIANLPVTPRNMLAILYDNKFHNGRFKSYNEFARDIRTEFGKKTSNKEVSARWNKNKDTFYSNIIIDPNLGVSMGENFKEKFGEKASEEFDFYHTRLTSKITQVNQSVDSIVSNEDQTMAQRDVLTNALLMHRGWFMINLTRKWKGEHFNIATNQFEAGHYTSLLGTLKKAVKRGFSKKDKEEELEVIEEHEYRNAVRAGVDAVGMLLLVALTNAMLDDDDEDDSVLENLAQLVAVRTTNETQSQHMIGAWGTIADMYKEPLVQRRLVDDFIQGIGPAIHLSDNKKKRDKFWKQNIIGRRQYQFEDLQRTLDTYLTFHKETLWWVKASQEKADVK